MKDIRIICVGKIKEKFVAEGIKDALCLIRRAYPAQIIECPDEATPDGASPAIEARILQTEGQRILKSIKKEDHVIALCIDGKRYDSLKWGRHLDQVIKQLDRSPGSLVFVIGGSLGLSEEVIRRANEKLSFSAMTFPHQLMRMVLLQELATVLRKS